MSSISPNFSPCPPNAQSALDVIQSNTDAIRQGRSGDTFTAANSSSAGLSTPYSSSRPSSAQSAPGATQYNVNAIPQGRSGDTCTAASSSSAWSLLTKLLNWVQTVFLSILQSSPAKQRWHAWVNADDILDAEQQTRQALAAQHKGRIQFSGEHIVIQGNLWIKNYPSLTSLPAGLKIEGNLMIENCPGFTSLPEDLVVEGDLNIENCPSFTILPLSILHMPPRSDGRRREITLENTGITRETRSSIETRLGEHPNLRVQLHWSQTQADDLDGFATLEQALDYWMERCTYPHEAVDTSVLDNLWPEQHDILRRFLSGLRGTAEAKRFEQALAERVKVLLEALQTSLSSVMITYVLDEAMSTCSDRILTGLDSAEQMLRIEKAECAGEEQLYELGLSLLKLEVVHQHARDKVRSLVSVDELEIYLKYEIKLAEQLDLPIQTRAMLFESCAEEVVTEEDIKKAAEAANAAVSDTQRVHEWMLNWAPMQQFQARKNRVA